MFYINNNHIDLVARRLHKFCSDPWLVNLKGLLELLIMTETMVEKLKYCSLTVTLFIGSSKFSTRPHNYPL